MSKSHYDTLGIARTSSADEIRTAYRKLVMVHHPDRSNDPRSKDIFLRVTEAYEVLGDPERRRHYDEVLMMRERQQAARAAAANPEPTPAPKPKPTPKSVAVATEVTRLTLIFSRGQFGEAEQLARDIIVQDARQPIPYAVLGDISRARGNSREAAKMYAYAVQMDPGNPTYQQRHEELLDAIHRGTGQAVDQAAGPAPVVAAGSVVLLSATYLMLTREQPLFTTVPLISTITLGLIVMSFLSGVICGACLAAAGMLDRFGSSAINSVGRLSPALTLIPVAAVSFWMAAVLYFLLGLTQRAFNFSTSRVLLASASVTLLFTAASLSSQVLNPTQVLLWSGNVTYLGSLCGWLVADSFRR